VRPEAGRQRGSGRAPPARPGEADVLLSRASCRCTRAANRVGLRCIAVVGRSGAGKSTLRRGARRAGPPRLGPTTSIGGAGFEAAWSPARIYYWASPPGARAGRTSARRAPPSAAADLSKLERDAAPRVGEDFLPVYIRYTTVRSPAFACRRGPATRTGSRLAAIYRLSDADDSRDPPVDRRRRSFEIYAHCFRVEVEQHALAPGCCSSVCAGAWRPASPSSSCAGARIYSRLAEVARALAAHAASL